MGEIKKLKKIGKKLLDKSRLKKIKKIKNKEDKALALRHSIISYLKSKHLELQIDINDLKKKGKDLFFIDSKNELMIHKIKYFSTSFKEEHLNKVLSLFNDIEEELKNVKISKEKIKN